MTLPPRRGDLGVAPRALPQVTRHPGGVADLGVWVTIILLLAITVLALGQWVSGAFTPATDKVTPQTVAPAVQYQPEPAP